MATRRSLGFVLIGIFASLGAQFPTANFVVEAPTVEIAQRVGQWAEYYRQQKAIQWIGREMPQWPVRCPLQVTVTRSGAGGATSFEFQQGQVFQTMHIEGPLDRLIASVLPHEVTHTVFAHYFRCPVPRWADEGGAVLSEDDIERSHHDMLVRQIINSGHAIPLGRLFPMKQYPSDVAALYAEGYSVSDFLVSVSNRQTFLGFVAHGMQYGWDSAARTYYHYQNVDQLQTAWLDHLRRPRQSPTLLAQNNTGGEPFETTNRVTVRLTAPPVQPLADPAPVYRGQSPEIEQVGNAGYSPRGAAAPRPGYLPDYNPNAGAARESDAWQPSGVRLGNPQFAPQPAAAPPPGQPASASPVGYPYQ